ncbi:GDP-mannose 4,6-dehydratase [Neomoorella thermoacetica]|uniref:GDP-mannose 4,6-dehydratase n=1 Tax=Neomoorella thermoacetica TaxID=1525 RepID=UPI0030CD5952
MQQGQVGEVYNVGANNEHTNLDIVKTILRLMNKPESLITFVKDWPGHDQRYAINATKINQNIGWKSSLTFT